MIRLAYAASLKVTFDPQTGHEQAGRRPAVVLSPGSYNSRVGLALPCPITNQIKGYPFEVRIPVGLPVPDSVVNEVLQKLNTLLQK